ncbi:hypothetical protein Tco_1109713 [Tanacetum coccineum]|uniref:Uncharacterized protein n=1 Tax=Tanacetum coccineum TaxID=301880 RepID=A0ABQ5II32_9ASTR
MLSRKLEVDHQSDIGYELIRYVDMLYKFRGFVSCKGILGVYKEILVSTKCSSEVGTLRYLSLVVPLKKVGDKAVHKELGDRMERVATTASSLEAEQDSGHHETEEIDGIGTKLCEIVRKRIERTTTTRTNANGEVELTATIDGQEKTLTEASLRRHLKLEDNGGVTTLPNSEIFEQLVLMGNMKMASKGYSGVDIPLFSTMITPPSPSLSPSRITSSPSLSPQTHLSSSQPPITQPTPDAEEPVSMPHDSPLQSVHLLERAEGSMQQNELTNLVTKLTDRVAVLENDLQQTKKLYSSAFTKLILRVKKLEKQVKTTKARRRARIVVLEEEDALEDSSKQGRKISDIDQDPTISLEKKSDDTEILLEEQEPTEFVEDFGSGEKGKKEVSTADVPVNTVDVPVSTARPFSEVSTAAGRIQERLRHEEAIRLQEQINEEERQRISRDEKIARQLQEQIDIAEKEKVIDEAEESHDIDWSDPAVIRYHSLQNRPRSVAEERKNMCIYLMNQGGYKMSYFKGMSYEEIRPLFERLWDQNHTFVPKDSEMEKEVMKIHGFDLQQESTQKNEEIKIEKDVLESSKKAGGRRKRSLTRKRGRETLSEESAKKQKLEEDTEKEELQVYLNIVSEDEGLDVESLATKYPMVDWETQIIGNKYYYQIKRADGSVKHYNLFSAMLYDFDRQYVLELYRLVKERFQTGSPDGYDLLLWGDLKTMIEPNEEDEKKQPRRKQRKDTEVPQPSGPTEHVADKTINEENVSKHSNDPLLSGEDSIKLNELMELCTTLQSRVLALETTKTNQALKIDSLKRRVKNLEKKASKRTHKLKRLYKVGLSDKVISFEDKDEDITLDSTHFDTDPDMFGVHDLDGDEVFVETEDPVVNAAITTSTIPVSAAKDLSDVDMTLAQALAELKNAKPKAVTTAATTTTTVVTRPKAKGLVIQEQEQISTPTPIDCKRKKEANVALIAQWNDIQDKVETDYELAQRLQAEEQEELTTEEKSKLFVQLLEKRRKHFAAKRAKERRNIPPTKAQQRKLFDKAMKGVNTFVDMDTELVEGSKKAEAEVMEESSMKDKAETTQESSSKRAVPDDGDDVTIKATPLSIKSPTIVDYKIYKEVKKSFFQIIRADGNSQMYLTFTKMLKNFNREDLEVLWGIVKARFKKTELVNYMDKFLHLNLKTMFEHHVEDNVWKEQQGLVKVLNWKLFDSCEVHCVTMQSLPYYLLAKKMYPLTKHTLHQMFNDVKLQVDYECEMAYELLRLVKKRLKEGYVPE